MKSEMFVLNFKISFIVSLSIVYHLFYNHCSFTYTIPIRATMGSIRSSSDGTGSGYTGPRVFIQCFNGWDTMAN